MARLDDASRGVSRPSNPLSVPSHLVDQVCRTIKLPQDCDETKASCEFKDGVLTVCIPKKTGASSKKKV